ncbi:hypothetical protein P8452_31491 [Trifolium repens]|nr:hypothetical protein P8452_31491 [Trifolium repens]
MVYLNKLRQLYLKAKEIDPNRDFGDKVVVVVLRELLLLHHRRVSFQQLWCWVKAANIRWFGVCWNVSMVDDNGYCCAIGGPSSFHHQILNVGE